MKFFKSLKDGFKKAFMNRSIRENHKHIDPDTAMDKNIYGAEKIGCYVKKQDFIFGFVKYGVIAPGIKFVSWIGRKHFEKKIPLRYEYRFINAFERAVDDGLIVWSDLFLYGTDRGVNPSRFVKDWFKSATVKLILRGKNILLTSAKCDTAYMALFDIVMQQLKKQLGALDTDGYISYHNKNGINDPAYFVANTFRNEVVVKERVRQTRHWYDEEGKLFVKDIGGYKQLVKVLSNELCTTPDKLKDKVFDVLRENDYLWGALLKVNHVSADGLTKIPKQKINLELQR